MNIKCLGRFVSLFIVVTGLTACGGGSDGSAPNDEQATTQQTQTNDLTPTPPAVLFIANQDDVEVTENSPQGNNAYGGPERTINVLVNDDIADRAATTITSVTSPTRLGGTVSIDVDNNLLIYTPPASARSPQNDVFEYTIEASENRISTGTVNVTLKSTACLLASVLCVGPGEEYNTNSPDPETALNSAVLAAKPGDAIKIRGGTYQHVSNNRSFLNVAVSGTASQPITIEPYNNEKVIFKGWGFTEGVVPTRSAEVIIQVTGDYIHIKGIEVSDSTRYGIDMSGSYGRMENVIGHDCWWSNLVIGAIGGRTSNNNVISGVESYRSRHGGGIMLTRRSTDTQYASNNVIENSISYNNGYQPNGLMVPGVPGDPSGGGNSDGIVVGKDCNDRAVAMSVDSICPNTTIRNNVTWHNADDGIDNPLSVNAVIADNISFDAGAEGGNGFKGLRYVKGGITYIGNITVSNYKNGFEPRMNGEGYMYHNLAAQHSGYGMYAIIQNATKATAKVYNNLVYNNRSQVIVKEPANTDQKTNWIANADGQVPNPTFAAGSVNTTFPNG